MVDATEEGRWVERSRRGDRAAFECLVSAHQRMIFAITFRMTGSMASAEDLVQETFVRAWQQLDGFRGESRFSTWLNRIAVNMALNWRVRESRRSDIHRQWAQDCANDGGGAGLPDELSRRVQHALQRLPEGQRAAIILTVYENLSHGEAARVLECSEATVSWRVFAARQKLKRWLTGAAGE